MESLKLHCPHCGRLVEVPSKKWGNTSIPCPACRRDLVSGFTYHCAVRNEKYSSGVEEIGVREGPSEKALVPPPAVGSARQYDNSRRELLRRRWGELVWSLRHRMTPSPLGSPADDEMVSCRNCGISIHPLCAIKTSFLCGQCANGIRTDSLSPIRVNSEWGYRDREGKVVIAPQFFVAREFRDGLACVAVEKPSGIRFGYIDQEGEWIVEPQFSDARDFFEKRALVRQPEAGWGYINDAGRFVVKPVLYDGTNFHDGLAAYCVKEGGRWGFLDRAGKVRLSPRYTGGIACGLCPDSRWLEDDGKPMFSEGLAAIDIGFESIGSGDEGGTNDLYGYINKRGKQVLGPFYTARHFHNGTALVDVALGVLIDKQGRVVKRLRRGDHIASPGDFHYW